MKRILLLSIASLAMLMADFTLIGEQLTPVNEPVAEPIPEPIPEPTPVSTTGSAKTNWGFQGFTIPGDSITISPGTDNIQAAIDSLTNGGTVNLEAGTFNITNRVWLKANIVLKGAGRNQTKLKFTGTPVGSGESLLNANANIDYNIILRDFEFDATGMGDGNAITFANDVYNILIENIEVYGGGRGNITFYGDTGTISKDITVRDVISHDNYYLSLGHGVSFRYATGVKVENYEAYGIANALGIDFSHVDYGEIANANIYNVSQGVKFPGSTHIYMHHVTIDDVNPAVSHEGGGAAIRLNRHDMGPQHMHIENVTINDAEAGIVDWGDAYPAPTSEELILNNITVTNIHLGGYTYPIKGVNNLYEYGNTVGKVTSRNGGVIVRRTTTTSPEADGVGYSSWGNP